MPIDFNVHNWFLKPVQNVEQQSVVQSGINLKNVAPQDSFVKNIQVSDKNITKDFDGMKITKKHFGTIEKTGEVAELYTITNKNGASVDLSSFGATIVSLRVPDKNGKIIDVLQGYDSVTPYENFSIGHAGGTIGPCANKINNGSFKLNDKEYKLKCNKDNGKTHSHGAEAGFDIKNWKAEPIKDGIKFSYLKKDLDGGYPANVKTSVIYKFDNNNNLTVNYLAETDNDTILNITNHAYFNLDGADKTEENSVMNHSVYMPNSSKYTPVNEMGIPTGELLEMKNSKFDFTSPKNLSEMDKNGYDQNFVVDGYDAKKMIDVAEVKAENSGIKMTVSTNLPGFQFYTANNLGKSSQPLAKDGKKYEKHSGLCVEPQFFPDAINTFEEKPILRKGETYNRTIKYSFSVGE